MGEAFCLAVIYGFFLSFFILTALHGVFFSSFFFLHLVFTAWGGRIDWGHWRSLSIG